MSLQDFSRSISPIENNNNTKRLHLAEMEKKNIPWGVNACSIF